MLSLQIIARRATALAIAVMLLVPALAPPAPALADEQQKAWPT
jgi:hypothetical protein